MTDFDNTWKNADPDAAGGNDLEPPEDGAYDVALTEATAFESKEGKPFVKLVLRVVSLASRDYEWTVLLGFKSQSQANMTKRIVRDVGVDVDEVAGFEELGDALNTKIGQYYTVKVVTNGEFRNTYIEGPANPQTDIPIPEMPVTVPETTDDGDIPF